MKNTNEKTISEEKIAEIVSAAQGISDDSTELRQNLVAIAKGLQPMIQKAGIEFGSLEDNQMWTTGTYPDQWTLRITIKKILGEWDLGVEETQYSPEWWDGSNWVGYSDPFCEEAYTNGAVMVSSFSQTSRRNIEEVYARLVDFLIAYSEELKHRHLRYADLREKTAAMLKIVEG